MPKFTGQFMKLLPKFTNTVLMNLGGRWRRAFCFFAFFVGMCSCDAVATDIRFTSGDYSFNDGQVTMHMYNIGNYSGSIFSGSLRMQLWAFSSPYNGGSATGYEIAESQNFGPLGPGARLQQDTETVNYSLPPNGTYYITLILIEYTGTRETLI